MNEVNGFPFMMFWQLQRKTRVQTIVDYNPTSRFWVHDKVIPGDSQDEQYKGYVQFYRTWHQHNPFLTAREHERYEKISDKDMFAVYSRGMTGNVRGLIFGHFKKMPKWIEVLPTDRIIWGIDYGYTNDPTAIVMIIIRGDVYFVKECAYKPGMSDEEIWEVLYANGFTEDHMLYSEADPDMINQLRMRGLPVYPAIKGPGSVKAGIAKVREKEVWYFSNSKCEIDPSMSNFEKELTTYRFLEGDDMITGKLIMLNKPDDVGWDHLCDATRYAIYTDTFLMAQAA